MIKCFCGAIAIVTVSIPNKDGEKTEKKLCAAHLNYTSLLRNLKSQSRILNVRNGTFEVNPSFFKPYLMPHFSIQEGEELTGVYYIKGLKFTLTFKREGNSVKLSFKGLRKLRFEVLVGSESFKMPPFEFFVNSAQIQKPIIIRIDKEGALLKEDIAFIE